MSNSSDPINSRGADTQSSVAGQPMLIAVAPNGARKTKKDHPALPITPPELAETARACLASGAAMLHLHVRDASGRHSLLPEYYEPALRAIEDAVGEDMLIQVTSEAAGIYNRAQQMAAMRALMPKALSVALRELVPDAGAYDEAAKFFADMQDRDVFMQYILYTPQEVETYHRLIDLGVIPRRRNLLLFVLGRYQNPAIDLYALPAYLVRNLSQSPWMCCAFGAREQWVMRSVAKLGGHARVGFENNLEIQAGKAARANHELVAITARGADLSGRPIADVHWLRRLQRELSDGG